MMRVCYWLPVIFWLLTGHTTSAQFHGKVLDAHTRLPIAFANIGLPGKLVGTLSDPDGTFSLVIPRRFQSDTVLFSALGYDRKWIPVAAWAATNAIVYLSPKPVELPTLQVTAKRTKGQVIKIGNSHVNTGWIENDSLQAGAAMALRLSVDASKGIPPFYITHAQLRIWKATQIPYQVRLRLYEVDSLTGLPGRDLLGRSILISSRARQGWLELDVENQAIALTQHQFFLAFEWIITTGQRRDIARLYQQYKAEHPDRRRLDSVLINGRKQAQEIWNYGGFQAGTAFGVSYNNSYTTGQYVCFSRKSSFDRWQRATGILTAQLTLRDSPPQPASAKIAPPPLPTVEAPCSSPDAACQTLQFLEQFRRQKAIPGLQVAVSLNGKTVLSQGLGLADIARQVPVSVITQFRVGSVSKALTSVALLRLVADQQLNLDVPVQTYVPSFPIKRYPITTRQLAGHLAGIRHYRLNDPGDFIHQEHYATARQALKLFSGDSLLFEPNTRYHYSSFGWNLLGAVIEGASGQTYLDYMRQQIWLPLGMQYTVGDVVDSLMPYRSQFYLESGQVAPREDLSYKYAGGGLVSTAEDLMTYGRKLLNQLASGDSLTRLLFKVQTTRDGQETGYGLGWNIGTDAQGHRLYWHDGDLTGSSAYLLLYPDDGLVIAVLANAPQGIQLNAKDLGARFYAP